MTDKSKTRSVAEVAIRICLYEAWEQRSFKPLTWLWKRQIVGSTNPWHEDLYFGTMFEFVEYARRNNCAICTIRV